MRPPIFRGRVDKGRIKLDIPDRFKTYLSSFEGKRIELVLRERRAGRSDQQNRYYHGVVLKIIADYLGYTTEEMGELVKEHFNIESTSKLSTKEFNDHIERVVGWAAQQFGVYIPDPNSVDLEES